VKTITLRQNTTHGRSTCNWQILGLTLLPVLWSCGGTVSTNAINNAASENGESSTPEATPVAGALAQAETAAESAGNGQPGSQPELCDGLDNDLDGETDEGLDAGSCQAPSGEYGLLRCLDRHVRCVVCAPGATRTEACGCDIDRIDTCGQDGQWVMGLCDGCSAASLVPCGYCGHIGANGACVGAGECAPGTTMIRRCDTCPDTDGCGADTCVGEAMRCSNECLWTIVEPCRVRQRQCSRDEVRTAECGQCGETEGHCDGCFWEYGECDEHGECFRGESASVPCGSDCGAYRVAQQRCTESCTWSPPSGCEGCQPGGPYYSSSGCACSDARQTVEFYCEVTEADNACGLGVGLEVDHTVVEPCPPVPCSPGETDSSGGLCRICDENCIWTEWLDCGPAVELPPDTETPPCGCSGTRTESCNDACGNSRTYECQNCTWVLTQACPPCSH
jgi:hypothetical protein